MNALLLLVLLEDGLLLELLLLVLLEDDVLLELLVEGVSIDELLDELPPVLLEHPASVDKTTASANITAKILWDSIKFTPFPQYKITYIFRLVNNK